jgi:hypothetical protein
MGGLVAFRFDDIERKAMPVLHAGGTKNRSQATGCPALLPDYFANVVGGHAEAKHRGALGIGRVNMNRFGIIYQRSCYLEHQGLHV